MGLGDLPAAAAEYLAKMRAEAEKDPEMKAEIEEAEARSAREYERIRKEQQAENEKTNPIVRTTKEALYHTVKTTKMLCEDYGRLEQQVHEWQERGLRYRAERDEARTENVELKESNDDKDRKIAALERQLAAASTS